MRDLETGDVIYSPMPWFWVGGLVFVAVSAMHLGGTLLCDHVSGKKQEAKPFGLGRL